MNMQKYNEKYSALAIIILTLVCYVAHTSKYLTYLLTLRYVLKYDSLPCI